VVALFFQLLIASIPGGTISLQMPGGWQRLDPPYVHELKPAAEAGEWDAAEVERRAVADVPGDRDQAQLPRRQHDGECAALRDPFMLLRGLIENGLYAVHIKADATRGRIWMARHHTAEDERRVRSEFTVGRVLDTVHARNSDLARIVRVLYDRCLDLGAHPTQHGHFATHCRAFVVSYGNSADIENFLSILSDNSVV
jgi:hypothetical protein